MPRPSIPVPGSRIIRAIGHDVRQAVDNTRTHIRDNVAAVKNSYNTAWKKWEDSPEFKKGQAMARNES